MDRYLKSLFTTPLTCIVVFLLVLNLVIPFYTNPVPPYESQILAGGRLPEGPRLHDDTTRLTFREFRAFQEKQAFAENLLTDINHGYNGSGTSTPFIGFEKFVECFDCLTAEDYYSSNKPRITSYYLVLPGYTLRDRDSHFYMEQRKPHLQYPVIDASDTTNGGSIMRRGHYAQKVLPFRYSYRNKEEAQASKGRIMIAISAATYDYFSIPVFVLILLLALAWFYISVIQPIKVVIRIAQGTVFTDQNVRQLFAAAWAWIIAPFAILFLQLVFRLIFHRYFTSDVQWMPWTYLRENQLYILGGFVLLAIAGAFAKGLSLQEEQTLTI